MNVAEAPPVAGRAADMVEFRDDGRVRVRLYIDEHTGLLLRREQFDEAGQEERTVAFREISFDGSGPAPDVPPEASAVLARQAPSFRPVGSSAPQVLGDGYLRLGVYRRGPVLHVHYSDGLFELSVFEQAGRLDDDELPSAGRTLALGEHEATLYSWPGGHLLVWQAGPVVRTAVSDAPAGQMLEAARQLPRADAGRPSLLQKLRRACSALVDPLQ
jgi:sigma-E factor negative regulatory protein RseB